MKRFIKPFFTEKNENYRKAKIGITNIKKKFDGFMISFPDITPHEIMFIKEKWEKLPKSISNGVKIMALDFIGNSKSLFTSYEPNSYIIPHKHKEEYEHGLILKGQLIDRFGDEVYNVGDVYTIEPNQVHYLTSSDDGCFVYSELSNDKENKLTSPPKKLF